MLIAKTKPTKASVAGYLASIDNAERRDDCEKLIELMTDLTGQQPKMWGTIVGFGHYHYRYESGHEGDSMCIGFANRKTALTVYIMNGFDDYTDFLSQLGTFNIGKSCLHINRLADIDIDVLRRIVKDSLVVIAEKYGSTWQEGDSR